MKVGTSALMWVQGNHLGPPVVMIDATVAAIIFHGTPPPGSPGQ